MLAAQTVTKAEFRSSQTHEFEAIKKLYPVFKLKVFTVAPFVMGLDDM